MKGLEDFQKEYMVFVRGGKYKKKVFNLELCQNFFCTSENAIFEDIDIGFRIVRTIYQTISKKYYKMNSIILKFLEGIK